VVPPKGACGRGATKGHMAQSPKEDTQMKMKYNMLLLSYRGQDIQRLIQLQRLHLLDCATLTKTHPGRLCNMSAPNPTWPPSAQRSFKLVLKIDKYLNRFFTYHMNEDVRIEQRQRREEVNEHNQMQKLLPLWWRITCGLEHERPIVPPPPISHINTGRRNRGWDDQSVSARMQRDGKARNARKSSK
jgi:hypothetical protein